MKTLLIDNYDSYTFNLYQLIALVSGEEPIVVQNDDYESDWEKLCTVYIPGVDFHNIIVSPGPGHPAIPKDVGLSVGALQMKTIPVFGVCLGHQLLAQINGSLVVRAPAPVHGQVDEVYHTGTHMFNSVPNPCKVVRYHSLIVSNEVENPKLRILGRTNNGLIMGLCLEDDSRIAWGVQFHPESICSEYGAEMLRNFFSVAMLKNSIPRIIEDERVNNHVKHPILDDCAPLEDHVLTIKSVDLNQFNICEIFDEHLRTESNACFWLDSAQHNSPASRFSYMGNGEGPLGKIVEFFINPEERSFHGEFHEICPSFVLRESKNNQVSKRRVDIDIFEYLDESIERWRSCIKYRRIGDSSKDLNEWDFPFPFPGGYVGYLGYGLRKLCGIKATIARSAPPEVRRKLSINTPIVPDYQNFPTKAQIFDADEFVPDSSFLFVDRVLVWDHQESRCHIVILHPVAETSPATVSQMEWLKCIEQQLTQTTSYNQNVTIDTTSENPLISSVNDLDYKKLVNDCIELITAGETYEVCLTKQLGLQSSKLHAQSFDIYKNLRQINPAPYAGYFGLQTGKDESNRKSDFAICCSSPERFLRIDSNGRIESKPIKGTIGRGVNEEEDNELKEKLLNSVKDRSENLMITDLVRNDIGKVCEVGSVTVPKLMHIESFTSVHQMVTTIEGKLKRSCSPMEAVRAAFPGGSMTGAPKLRTMQIIDKLEPFERGVYSGALGYFGFNGAIDLNIVIRTAVITPKGISVGAGGAIVALSDPQEEVDETKLKAWKLQTAVSPFIDK